MKKHLLFWVFSYCFLYTQAQSYSLVLEENNYTKSSFSLLINSQNIQYKEIKTELGYFTKLTMDESFGSTTIGLPELPTIVKLMELPFCDSISLVINHIEWDTLSLSDMRITQYIYPAQLSLSKSDEPNLPIIDSSFYNKDTLYYPYQNVVNLTPIGIMRSVRMAELKITPILYNPLKGIINVMRSLSFEIVYHHTNVDKTLRNKSLYSNNYFNKNTASLINAYNVSYKDANSKAPIKYIIVSDPMFKSTLQPFIQWKKQQGYIVVEAYTNETEVGTTKESIKAFLQKHYDEATTSNPAQTFVLFGGDVEQIPAYSGYDGELHVTDLYYCDYTGDYLPECYYGRFSAQNVTQLVPQIEKTLQYEKYTMANSDYLNTALLVAGSDQTYAPTHANGEINYIYNNYINTIYGFSKVFKFLYNSSDKADMIRNYLYEGIGIGLYTAHCEYNGWVNPAFQLSHIENMTNINKYGVLIGNCCLSNRFDVTECFGEALLRTPGKGCVAYIGATDNTMWDEDYYWAVGYRSNINANPVYESSRLGAFDKWFHYNNEDYDNQFITASGIIQGGNLSVQSTNSLYKRYYWEVYHVMGDPSLMPWIKKPKIMNVDYPTSILVGTQQMKIEAVPYSYIALLSDTGLITATFANANGHAILNFNPVSETQLLTLAVSAQNYQFYKATITVSYPEGPILNIRKIAIYDSTTKGTQTANYGQNISLDLIIENIGKDDAENVAVKLYSNCPYIQIEEDSIYIGTFFADSLKEYQNLFAIHINSQIPDGEIATLHFIKFYNQNSWIQSFDIQLHSAQFEIVSSLFKEPYNTLIEPSDTVHLEVVLKNSGSVATENYTSILKPLHSYVSGNELNRDVTTLTPDEVDTFSYLLTVSALAENGDVYPILFSAYNDFFVIQDTFYLPIGKKTETFETGDFSQYSWNQNNNAWEITNQNVYEGLYAARSKTDLSNDSSSIMQITWTSVIDDSISYYCRISSEAEYDYFKFIIDDEVKEEISGYRDTVYHRSVFFVPAGTHQFKFIYKKDYASKRGYDCAFIDQIVLPMQGVKKTEKPDLEIISYQIDDSLENHNQKVEYKEHIFLNLTLKNNGDTDLDTCIMKVSVDNSQITLDNDTVIIPIIKQDSLCEMIHSIGFTVSEFCLNQTLVNLSLSLPSGITLIPITLKAPDLIIGKFEMETSNDNEYIEPNEDIKFKITILNQGDCQTGTLLTSLKEKTIGQKLGFEDTIQTYSPVFVEDSIVVSYQYKVDDFKTNFYPTFDFIVKDGNRILYYNFTKTASFNLGICETISESSFKLYPNPAHKFVNIQCDSEKSNITMIKLYNMTGQVVKQIENPSFQTTISLPISNLSKGIYLMEIYDSQNYKTIKKLIKQ